LAIILVGPLYYLKKRLEAPSSDTEGKGDRQRFALGTRDHMLLPIFISYGAFMLVAYAGVRGALGQVLGFLWPAAVSYRSWIDVLALILICLLVNLKIWIEMPYLKTGRQNDRQNPESGPAIFEIPALVFILDGLFWLVAYLVVRDATRYLIRMLWHAAAIPDAWTQLLALTVVFLLYYLKKRIDVPYLVARWEHKKEEESNLAS
jgi:hypothetical protein